MRTITGKVIPGLHAGAENLKVQLPLVIEEFPEIRDTFLGTINLELDKGLLVLSSDHRTRPINWHPEHAPGEVFDFLRIRFEGPEGSQPISAWLYIAHNSPHRSNLKIHELIISSRAKVEVGSQCKIHLLRPSIELPYREYPIVVAF